MDHEIFQSPFSWRYGSAEMRGIWSEVNKRRLWRRIWVALARAQQTAGIVTAAQADDLAARQDVIDIDRAEVIEAEIHHDLMAEVRTYAEQCPIGGGIIHLGATSADIEDNADALRLRQSLDLVLNRLSSVLRSFARQIVVYADLPTMALTHLQPAEPTVVGYRLASYAQDLLEDYAALHLVRDSIRGKGFKGAVGTRAAYAELLAGTDLSAVDFEAHIMGSLDLASYPITGQTYPRKQDHRVVSALAGLAGSIYRFAFDLRILQSPYIGEWREPFSAHQVGSSAMPFKRNPINAEKLNSIARLSASLVQPAWDNAAHSLLERTLDDSANRREMLPLAFLAADELLKVTQRLIDGLHVDEGAVSANLARFGPFAALERVLMAAVKAGADRQQMHECLRTISMRAWSSQEITLIERVLADSEIARYLSTDQVRLLMDASGYVGDAPQRARQFASQIEAALPRDA